MKTIALILIITSFISCKKDEAARVVNPQTPSYYATYTNTSGDTAYVTDIDESIYSSIRWCQMGNGGKYTFDSVVIAAQDSSITVNQLIFYNGAMNPVVGTGQFGTNTLNFHFVIAGGDLYFSGVKRQ